MSRADDAELEASMARHAAGRRRPRPACDHEFERFVADQGRWSYRCHLCDLIAIDADAALDLLAERRIAVMLDSFAAERAWLAHVSQAMRLGNPAGGR